MKYSIIINRDLQLVPAPQEMKHKEYYGWATLLKVDHRVEMPSSHFKTLFFPIPWITLGIILLYSFKDERIRYCLLLWLVIGHKV